MTGNVSVPSSTVLYLWMERLGITLKPIRKLFETNTSTAGELQKALVVVSNGFRLEIS